MRGFTLLAAVIDLDITFFVQLVLFLIVVVVLNRLVFQPMLDLFARRKAETVEREQRAEEGKDEAEALTARYHNAINEATTRGMARRNERRDEALREEAEVLGKARTASAAWLEEQVSRERRAIDAQRDEARGEIEKVARDVVDGLTRVGTPAGSRE